MIRIVALVLAFAGLALPAAEQPLAAEAPAGRVILVLDASGSMWAQIEGRSKIEIAREAVASLVADWDPAIELGLTAYGHRRKGDCGDIETILRPGTLNRENFVGTVNAINPRGKTPLSAAVRQAAEQLKYTEEKATVILVSDGEETCEMDPCALATELEAQGVDFTTHIIGFDLTAEQQAGLQCLADNTGGLFLNAGNAQSLRTALSTVSQEVVKRAVGLKLIAVSTEGAEPLTEGIEWWIDSPEPGADGQHENLGYNAAAQPLFVLPTGSYRVRIRTGNVNAVTKVDVTAGEAQEHTVVLGAGDLKLIAYAKQGGSTVDDGLEWWIDDPTPDQSGNHANIGYQYVPQPVFTLPAGLYRLRIRVGGAIVVTREVTVTAGKLTEQPVYLDFGRLHLSAQASDAGPQIADGLEWWIDSPEPDASGEHANVTYMAVPQPQFVLPAGDYRVRIRQDGMVVRTTRATVPVDQTVEQPVVLLTGKVKLRAVVAATGEPITGIHWSIVQTAGDGTESDIAFLWTDEPLFTLPAGLLKARIGGGAISGIGEIEVFAGETQEISVEFAGP